MEKAIIVDLDGTLADNSHRLHYIINDDGTKDWDKFFGGIPEDTINPWCKEIIIKYRNTHKILFVTGRPDRNGIKPDTIDWLAKHSMLYNYELHMRGTNDYRKDVIVKSEILNSLSEKYEFTFALEDRSHIAKAFREKGIITLQVAEEEVR